MHFYEINNCQVMIFSLYIIYSKRAIMKIYNETRENFNYCRKLTNNFSADCTVGLPITLIKYVSIVMRECK